MTTSNTSTLLRSLAKLIEKPEIRTFQQSLINTLTGIVESEFITLYEIRTLRSVKAEYAETFLVPICFEDACVDNEIAPVLLNQHAQFDEAFQTGKMVIKQVGDKLKPMFQSIYPIFDAKGVTGFLVIDCKKAGQRDQELIEIFLGFYRNYIALLNDNHRDHLTGLLNRKSFDDKIMKMILSLGVDNKRKAEKEQFCLALFDIDHFKHVNDTYGHLMGDEVLLHFSHCMNETFREYDFLFRVGGEEFVAVLRNVDAACAQATMERFRKVVETHYFPQVGQVTVSIGTTIIDQKDLPVTVMDRADRALYYAKDHGRNQVASFENLLSTGELQESALKIEVDLF